MEIKWMTYDEADRLDVDDLGSLGGLPLSITAKEYISWYHEDVQEYVKLLINDIRNNEYLFGGDSHQSSEVNGTPCVERNGEIVYTFMYSYRGWGDLMHCCHVDKEDEEMGYMDFYMDCLIRDNGIYQINYPKTEED